VILHIWSEYLLINYDFSDQGNNNFVMDQSEHDSEDSEVADVNLPKTKSVAKSRVHACFFSIILYVDLSFYTDRKTRTWFLLCTDSRSLNL